MIAEKNNRVENIKAIKYNQIEEDNHVGEMKDIFKLAMVE